MTVTQEPDAIIPAVGRLEGRLDRVKQRMDGLEQRMDGLEERMDNLSRGLRHLSMQNRWSTAALAALIAALGFWG